MLGAGLRQTKKLKKKNKRVKTTPTFQYLKLSTVASYDQKTRVKSLSDGYPTTSYHSVGERVYGYRVSRLVESGSSLPIDGDKQRSLYWMANRRRGGGGMGATRGKTRKDAPPKANKRLNICLSG